MNVFEVEGVIPWFERKVNVGRDLKSVTTRLKNATASALGADPLGKQDGSKVLEINEKDYAKVKVMYL